MVAIPERLVETRIGPAGSVGISLANIYTEFQVTQVRGSTPDKAQIKIWNLGELSLRQLETPPRQTVQLLAGEAVPAQFFLGDIARRGISTKQQGVDRITTIKAADGRTRFRESTLSVTYPPGTTIRRILVDIIGALQLGTGFITQDPRLDVAFPGGWAYFGKAREALTELMDSVGVGWYIQSGLLYIVADTDVLPAQGILYNALSGLRGSPERTDKGVNLTVKLDPRAKPGRILVLDSTLMKGSFTIVKATHKGNTRGSVWESKLLCTDR